MEMVVIVALVKKAVDILGNLGVEYGSRLYRLKEDIGWIQREIGFITSFLADTNNISNKNSQSMLYLQKVIRDLANDIIDLDARSQKDLSKKIKGFKKRVKQIKSARDTYVITKDIANGDLDHTPRLLLHNDDQWAIGLDEERTELMSKLSSPSLQVGVISIIGPPGVGKSTLAKIVCKYAITQLPQLPQLSKLFDCAAFVYISQQPNFKNVLNDLAKQVGLSNELLSQEGNLEKNLCEFLREKRFLIVFYDIWCSHTWDSLKRIIPFMSSKESRVIVTSRDSSVGRYAGTLKVLRLKPLNEIQSRELFDKLVMLHSKEATLQRIADQILSKCGGLPIAIVSMARLLTSRERSEASWLEILENFMGDTNNNRDDDWWEILALSYYLLPIDVQEKFSKIPWSTHGICKIDQM